MPAAVEDRSLPLLRRRELDERELTGSMRSSCSLLSEDLLGFGFSRAFGFGSEEEVEEADEVEAVADVEAAEVLKKLLKRW